MLSDVFCGLAKERLESILSKLTRNKYIGFLVGILVTAFVQSSNAISVMVIGFINSGVLSLERSVGLLLGTKIGTTITGQIIAFKIEAYAPIIAFMGVMLLFVLPKNPIPRILSSLGLLFMGLDIMGTSMLPLKNEQWFQAIIGGLTNPCLAILMGMLFTIVIQSVSASVGILQIMSLSGILDFNIAFFIMMGMNIGACVPCILVSLQGNKDGKRAAGIIVLTECIGTVLFLILTSILPIIPWIEHTSVNASRQIANANTIFNCVTVFLLLPISGGLIKAVNYLIKENNEKLS